MSDLPTKILNGTFAEKDEAKRRKLLAKQLKRESELVRDESLKILKEFDEATNKEGF